jgi:hypothetical protein
VGSVKAYVRLAIERKASDLVRSPINVPPSKALNGARPDSVSISKRTHRRYRSGGDVGPAASAHEVADAYLKRRNRQRHHDVAGSTIAEVAELCDRPQATVLKALKIVEAKHGPAPKVGRYYRLNARWRNWVSKQLEMMPSRLSEEEKLAR